MCGFTFKRYQCHSIITSVCCEKDSTLCVNGRRRKSFVNSLVFTWIYILIVLNVNRCETSGRVFCVVVKLVTVSVSRSLKAIKLTEVSDISLLN